MTDLPIPKDDLTRGLTLTGVDDPQTRRIALAGDVYTILVSGEQTAGRYCLIDMQVLDGGGPPPHRHDFEEMFTLLDGELEVTFRGETRTVRAPATINVPANAPHSFRNVSGRSAHMLCVCAPAGQDAFFAAIGTTLEAVETTPPRLSEAEQAAKGELAASLAAAYRTEFLT